MASIRWNQAGNAGEEEPSRILNDFAGHYYCDAEIQGDGQQNDGYSQERFTAFLNDHILPCRAKTWTPTTPIQQPPVMVNGCGDGAADVAAFQTVEGDRLEYWRAAEEGGGADLDDDMCALLETNKGKILIVGVAVGHPYVACNNFSFGNSDGSTNGEPMVLDMGASGLIQSMADRAAVYLYNQQH